MKNIEIKVSKKTRMVYLEKNIIGNDGENLQEKLVFSFKDEFVDGQARLEYEIDGEKYFAILTKVGESYEIPVKNVMTKEFQVNMQLVITEGTDENEIPVFKSNVFYVFVNKSINAETEEPDGYAQWLDIANTKLNSIDEVVLGVKEAVDYAKEQGDYAKKQAENIISASEEANEIISGFESNVEEYITAFNKNAENKVSDYNTNATNKVKEYDDNATEKLNAYNSNAETKLKEYNENANSKVEEYNVNADNRINDFNQNADSYLDALIPKNDASGVPIYVDDAAEYRVLNLDAKGKYKQETTTGKNLFNTQTVVASNTTSYTNIDNNNVIIVNNTDTDYRNVRYEINDIKPNTDYKFKATFTNTNTSITILWVQIYGKDTETMIFNTSYSSGTVVSFNSGDNTSLYIRIYATGSIGANNTATWNDIELVEASEFGDYEPYTGNQASPNPDFPSEIEVLEGYNLFDKDSVITGKVPSISNGQLVDSVNGATTDYIQIDNSLNYVLSYVLNGSGSAYALFYGKDYNYIGNDIINASNYNLSTSSYYSNVKYIRIRFDTYVNFNNIQLVKGITKPYLPYNNVGYRSVGKNLLPFNDKSFTLKGITYTCKDGELIVNGTSTGETSSNDNEFKKNFTFTIPAGNYRLQMNYKSLNNINLPTYLTKVSDGTRIAQLNGTTALGYGISLEEDTEVYLGFYVYNKTFENTNTYLMLEDGDTYSNYEPHQETITPIDLKGNFVGKLPNGVADNLLYKDRHIYLEKNVGKFVLDGNIGGGYNSDSKWFYVSFASLGIIPKLLGYKNTFISDYFIDTDLRNDKTINGISFTSTTHLTIRNANLTTLAEYKTWFSENKPEVYYPLETPELIDLGEYDLSTLQGTNNISLLANIEPSEMNLTYALDIKKYIDKKVQ